MVLRPHRRSRLRCAYCHGSVVHAARCLRCGTVLHDECHRELGRCPALGCNGRVCMRAPWWRPDWDYSALRESLGNVAVLGFYCVAYLFLGALIVPLFFLLMFFIAR